MQFNPSRVMTQLLVLAITYVICSSVFAGTKEYALPPEKVPSFVVPRTSVPPKIDGVIDQTEWREATAVGGVGDWQNDELVARPTTFFLCWDPDHMYFACRAYLRAGQKPNVPAGRSPGLAYVWDDGLELNFKPMGSNVPAGNKKNSYHWFLNCLGFIGDCSRNALGQQFKSWNPKFDIKTRLTEPGTAPNGGRWWEMEMSAKPEDFELEGKHKAGDKWRVMLGMNHMPGWMQARIPCNGSYRDPFGHNVVTLVEDTPAVQMTMESLSNPTTDGTATMKVSAYNPTASATALTLEVNVADTINIVETLKVAPGKSAEFVLNEKLPETLKSGKMFMQVRQGDRQLYRYSVSFKVGSQKGILSPATPPDKTKFNFQTRFNPVRSLLLVKGDTYYLDDPSQARALRYRVVSKETEKLVSEGQITLNAEYYLQDLIKLPMLEPGTYIVQATMELTGGKKLGPMTGEFVKKNEAKEFARWWGKKVGDIERVIPPYTALTRKGNVVGCLGREYELNALGLPASISSRSGAVSAAPARIVVVVNGKEKRIKIGKAQITESKDWRVNFKGKAKGASMKFEAAGWLEQDGLVYVELTYGPSGKAPVQIDSMRIEYPLSETDSECLVCIGPGGNYSSRTTKILPKDKSGRIWSTLETGISGSGMTIGSFYPTVWIGNDHRGLLWWADNDRGWVQDNDVPAHEAVRNSGEVVLVNNIVAKPTELNKPRNIKFSYIATPFKPLPKGWRMTQTTDDGTFFTPFRNLRKDSKTGEKVYQNPGGGLMHVNWIHPESRYPEEWDELWAEQKELADNHAHSTQWSDPYNARSGCNFTHMSFQIMGYGKKSLEDHVYSYFGTEWESGGMDTWNETYTDYAMTLFEPAFKNGGVRHTYWDIAMPMPFDDLLNGLAYRLPDGRVQQGYNGWNIRRFMMRLYSMQADAGLVPGGNGFHSTNSYLTIAMPWTDAVLDGELDTDLDTSPLDWVDSMPIERMRSMSSPHSWGVAICWMANLHSKVPGRADAAKRIQGQWVWMHDSWRNPYIPQLQRMPQSVLDWGINDEQAVYHPYWRNPYVTSEDEQILVSLWQLPDRIMLGVYNYNGEQAKDVTLKVDLDGLDLRPQLPWQEFIGVRDLWKADDTSPGAALDFHNAALSAKALQPHTLRLIGIRKY